MARTTIDIDVAILEEIRAIQQEERRPMGRIVSELLAEALTHRKRSVGNPKLEWVSLPMRALVDLSDGGSLYAAIDEAAPRDSGVT
jgi:hypothetical protein